MSLDSVPSNAHGGLDEQISQLMQCKPLSEQEVLYSVVNVKYILFGCCLSLLGGSVNWMTMLSDLGS